MSPIDHDELMHLWEVEDERHREVINVLRIRNREYQKTCEHNREWTHYEPDPSGNNDSYTECRKCGKQW